MFLLISIFPFLFFFLLWWLIPSKGTLGEMYVAKKLQRKLPDDFIIVNDVILPSLYGTTQIDHIVFSPYGIFIIETKNYKGWITGTDESEYWQKNVYGNKYKFRNPLMQNFSHQKAIQAILPLDNYCFHSIVVFSNKASLNLSTRNIVVNNNRLIESILSFTTIVIPKEDIQGYVNRILEASIRGKEAKKLHVANVCKNIDLRYRKINNGICPRCGGQLVNRKGKYGYFWGCSNYPKCHFIFKN
ncbi:MAG: NERD domain-containing protein [Prevotella sp.]|nr:NERD domain-containing protein [Candidatus Equicola faecalis]